MSPNCNSQISDSLFRLALNALHEKPDESAVVSSFSMAMALAMANLGAKGNTSREITDALFAGLSKDGITAWFHDHLAKLNTSGSPLSIASAIYLEKSLDLLESYTTNVMQNFDSKVEKVNFSGDPKTQVAILNRFVEEATKGHIKELFTDRVITPLTKLVLVNALHFKASFKNEFSESQTRQGNFYNEDSTAKRVEMMNETLSGLFNSTSDFDFASFNFIDSAYGFFLIVPKANLSDLKNQFLTSEHSLSNTLKYSYRIPRIHTTVPKFNLETSYDLVGTLTSIGIKDIFLPGRADLSGITEKGLHVSNVVHKAVFDLNERGVEAAAATAVECYFHSERCFPPDAEERVIKADKPFLFGVAYDNIPLFVGQYY
ncbi:hypothetical protein QR680_004170 [Steinernema hermaphroditum]|uniref:Serpin domain-containing protein n=1 Tax=Steinernema hermaphroditum TaxID=289476 RepID=A0AA39HPA1_9BILA|nr:hypothetical protein QR680_004170 [Steinernema hermaphroditum]